MAAADASLDAIAAELEEAYPALYRDRRVKVFPMTGIDQSMHDGVIGFVGVLLALSGLVLLTACLNVGGMMLARGSYRGREMAVRTALGAPRWRLVRQVLVEALVLLVTAGLFVRAAWHGARIDTGFDVEALATTFVGLPAERYDEAAALDLFERLTERVALSPLVQAASFAALPPIDVAREVMGARVSGFVDQDGDDQRPLDVHAVGDRYFATIGLPLRASIRRSS